MKTTSSLSMNLLSGLRRFANCRRGAVAVVTALSLTVIVGVVGLAIDFARVTSARTRVQDVVDAAALAAVRAAQISPSTKEQSARKAANSYIASAKLSGVVLTYTSIETDANVTSVTIFVDGYVVTPLLSVLSSNAGSDNAPSACRHSAMACHSLTAKATATAALGQPVEISLMVDLTWSMLGTVKGKSKLSIMKETLQDFVDIVLAESGNNSNVRIAVVPFSRNVNAGRYASKAMGLPEYITKKFLGISYTVRLYHCVTERIGTNAYTDAAPNETNGFVGPYGGVKFWGADYGNIGPRCEWPNAEVIPLTDDRNRILDFFNSIDWTETDPLTAGHLATAWSWYVLSPKWNEVWGDRKHAAANYGEAVKIAVLMTDGDYNIKFRNDPSAFAQAAELCKNMKNTGITVFTVGFDLKGFWVSDKAGAERVLSNCASDKDYFFSPEDDDEMKAAYREIALAAFGRPRLVR